MSSDIRLAFAHPIERAAAMDDGTPRDRISLRDHVVEVDIGAFQAERGVRQRVRFNVVVEVRPSTGAVTDDVDSILSYDRVTEAIAHELAAERLNLLETLAERVAERILLEPQALRVFVRIEKLDRGPGALGVEIVRSCPETQEARHDGQAQETPHPLVVYLSNAAIGSDQLGSWLDQLASCGKPVILTVGPSDLEAPDARHKMAQRRIDLLAIEQNAWVLAGRDNRCVVVGTRTELDWGMKNGQISVWAPSKIVLDSVETPSVAPRDSLALAQWFAEEMTADGIVCIGEAPKSGNGIAARYVAVDTVDLSLTQE
jgi:dihydroneopterin aldolase